MIKPVKIKFASQKKTTVVSRWKINRKKGKEIYFLSVRIGLLSFLSLREGLVRRRNRITLLKFEITTLISFARND